MFTLKQFKQMMPKAGARADRYYPMTLKAMQDYGITTNPRIAAFLATIAHESGQFRYMKEIWGPTPQQLKYEPPSTVAAMLGNTQPGDGERFMGRGPGQLTGRFNYTRLWKETGIDCVRHPEELEDPYNGMVAAVKFWEWKDCAAPADRGDFREVTRRWNGGYNGMEDRKAYYDRNLKILAKPDFSNVVGGPL